MIKTTFVIQEHYRKKMRKSHYDIRIVKPSKDKAFSWAIPKMKFPEDNEKVLAIRTPDHKLSVLKLIDSTLSNGDRIKTIDKGNCVIVSISDNRIIFTFDGKLLNGKYVFINIGANNNNENWLIKKLNK